MSTSTKIRAIGELALTLAEFYRFPDEEFYRQLAGGQWEARLRDLAGLAGFSEVAELPWPATYPDFPSLKQAYVQCFMGTGSTSAPPVESLYKVWTEDPTAQIAIAKQKGHLMGDGALHIKHLLQAFGLELPAELAQKPDHLVVLLELLALFTEKLTVQETQEYLADHFDWLADFYQRLQAAGGHEFYLVITQLLTVIVEKIPTLLQDLISTREVC